MSILPKPKALPKPAGSRKSVVSSPEHDELLLWTWANPDAISSCFVVSETFFAERHSEAVEAYQNGLLETEMYLRACCTASHCDYQEECGPFTKKLVKVADMFKACREAFVPPVFPTDTLAITVENRVFQYPLSDEKDNVIGFVDCLTELSVLDRCYLLSHTQIGMLWTLSPEELCALRPDAAPEWSIKKKSRFIHLDVRHELPTVGQLVQELKTLREYLDGESDGILIVVHSMDDSVRDILNSEKFRVFQRVKMLK